MSIFQKSLYGIATLFSLFLYLTFVFPHDFSGSLENHMLIQGLIFLLILLFPMVIAWLFVTRGKVAFFISLPFYLLGLFFLYRGFYLTGQFSMIDYLFQRIQSVSGNETSRSVSGLFIGIESFLFYIFVSEFGILLGYFLCKPIKKHQ
ncbi:MAG: hypothetical protein ACK4M9_11380 [Anaerobacillus sp.]|uniref:hypothetical protein n=1 Tax=Anaerobacillus sp. TaxID=1872506 RepID=UPI00391A6D03